MDRLKTTLAIVLLVLCAFSPALAAEDSVKAARYGYPGHMYNNGYHHGSLRVADLDLDDVAEIVLLQGNVLVVLDNQGTVLFTKEIDDLYGYGYRKQGAGKTAAVKPFYCGGGPYPGDPDDGYPGGPGGGDPDDNYYYGSHMGGVELDVANLDDEQFPEIIIRDVNKLIVLDNSGDLKTTIALPDVGYPYPN